MYGNPRPREAALNLVAAEMKNKNGITNNFLNYNKNTPSSEFFQKTCLRQNEL